MSDSPEVLHVMRGAGEVRPVPVAPGLAVGEGRPVVIAGPCAVESREQILAAATAVKLAGAHMLRGGAFKPRSSPYSFQGLGREGLELLAEARRLTGLPIVTEVLDVRDVELVARYADVLQIGSRNMQHYPLLREAGASRRPVLLKRGFAATIAEWFLAAEYIVSHGNEHVILCERGIRTFEPATRNTLDLAAVVLAHLETHLPVIVDPSHAAGRADLVGPFSRAALAAGADGLIIEVHPDPSRARSDAQQSLDPEGFARLMADLGVRAGVGVSRGASTGSSAGVSEDAGLGSSAGVSEDAGLGSSAGVSEGAGLGSSAGVSEGAGLGSSAGVSESVSLGRGSGARGQSGGSGGTGPVREGSG
jgi:3-deoxy-7-phosphoheptulonate synthase